MTAKNQQQKRSRSLQSSSGSDDGLNDNEIDNLITKIDPDRLIYDLKELKPILKQIFFYRRDHIKYGYRANPDMTIGKCTKTIFMCHCETGNIWTHLLAALYFVVHLILLIIRIRDLQHVNAAKKLAGEGHTMNLGDVVDLKEGAKNETLSPEVRDLSITDGNEGTIWSVLSGPAVNPYCQYNTFGSLVTQTIGCVSVIMTMCSSWIYHLYSAISKKCADRLLRIDLIGIGIMIFTLTLLSVYTTFYDHILARNNVMGTMIVLCACNLVIQLTPCYNDEEYECHRAAFYAIIMAICSGLAFYWYFKIATEEEAKLYTFRLAMSFIYLGIGFWFYLAKYPEKAFKKSRFVQLWL